MNSNIYIVGIAGGTASGKTTFASKLKEMNPKQVDIIYVDSYYRAQDHLVMSEREKTNYDHPNAFEFDLLIKALKDLRQGNTVQIPLYDYSQHNRSKNVQVVAPKSIILVEGFYALYLKELREMFDHSIFIDAPSELRFKRRLARDIRERGRSEQSVIDQWNATVDPMHQQFIEPTKTFADRVLSGESDNIAAMQEIFKTRAIG